MVKKIKIYKNFYISNQHKNSILLIGNFDGLHLGHQKLFKLAERYKKKYKIKIGILTFDPIPKMFFNKKLNNFKISSLNQKINFLKKFKIDFIIIKKFNKKFSKINYLNFIDNILFKKINPKYIFVSNNFRFGNSREGNVKKLKQLEKNYNFKIINPSPLKKKKKIISSTLIRKLISKGKIKIANKYLGRNWSISGTVKVGRKMGRQIGFPTCNIELNDYIIAKRGVYAVNVLLKDNKKLFKGIANIGYRPTFNQKKILLEVHIFNFSRNIYNKSLNIQFINFIRKERKFKNINQLKKQINLDLKVAKKVLK
tara:strand:+ start:1129 stop:2064 length:936 start_codon:yes stop_codon:yes gene_type:complete